MNYLHIFHAGNFADVHKHASLTLLLKAMIRKDSPLFYLETHAGGGIYDFSTRSVNRNPEWVDGISRLWVNTPAKSSSNLADYCAIIAAHNPKRNLRYYPGSPIIAQAGLRAGDRMILLEANFSEAQRLEITLNLNRKNHQDTPKRIHVRVGDGYDALKAWLPPQKERRGIIFIDPPFEQQNEFSQILAALITVQRYFSPGVIAVWYPLKNRNLTQRFYHDLRQTGIRRLLITELRILPEDVEGRFHGSGLLIHNPPWQLDQSLSALGEELAAVFTNSSSGTGSKIWWLTGD